MYPLVVGSGIVLGILCILFVILLINLFTFYRLKESASLSDSTNEQSPFLSILVPARDEERCIEACVRSLLVQNYEQLEVLVLDDHSCDMTAAIVQKMIAELSPEQGGRLRLLSGAALAQGWIGKNFACHQLAQHARGDYLLFTDADTMHAPGMARAVLNYMYRQNVSLLSGQPEFVLSSLGECLVVPLLNFTILTLLPIVLVRRRPESSLATGNGQLLCFQRAAYEKVGGHVSVKGRILEDVLLARAVKGAGQRMVFVDALELVRCRMYHTFAETWAGFSKNLFAFYNYALPFALVALLLNLALFVLPPLFVLAGLFVTLPATLVFSSLLAYVLAILMRILLSLRFTRSRRRVMLLLCLFHPISVLLECLILLNSMYWHYRKAGTVWKGRYYS